MTIDELLKLKSIAWKMPALHGGEWPPSVYYRYIAELVTIQNSKVFVELGTCGGGCARNVAIKNPKTIVITIDIDPLPQAYLAARQNTNISIHRGDSVELAHVLGLKYIGIIDTLFIDTVHEYDHVMREFHAWKPYLAPGAVVLFDDLNREGMDRVWHDLPGEKTEFSALKEMHIAGSPNDGGFGALIL